MKLTRRSLLAAAGGVALSPAIAKAAQLGSKSHIAVIGAGVFGAWTAHHLLGSGHRVTLIDAHGPAHSRASSGGESRMTRAAWCGSQLVLASVTRISPPFACAATRNRSGEPGVRRGWRRS